MSVRVAALIALLATTSYSAAAAVATTKAPPAAGVTVREAAGARVVEARLPGRVLATTTTANGRLAVLVVTAKDPEALRSVFLLDVDGEGSLRQVVSGLPSTIDAIGRLAGEVIVGEPGRIHSLGPLANLGDSPQPRRLLEAPHLDLRRLQRHRLLAASVIYQPAVGSLRTFTRGGSGVLERGRELEMPVVVRREPTGLRLETLPVAVVARGAGPPLIVAGPRAQGSLRLLTTVVAPEPEATEAAEDGDRREIWSRLPAPESVADSFYLTLDGRPTLIVSALSAEKIGIFERKKLRVFPLWSDRTRAGTPSTLNVMTTSRRWQRLGVEVADLDRDGDDDLIVIQRDGLGGKKVVVEAFASKGNGGFFSRSRKTAVVAPEADWSYGTDLDGDDVPDLVAVTYGTLLVFRGLDHKKLVVEKKPGLTLDLSPSGAGDSEDSDSGDSDSGDSDSEDDDSGDDDSEDDDFEDRLVFGERLRVIPLGADGRHRILAVSYRDPRVLRVITPGF